MNGSLLKTLWKRIDGDGESVLKRLNREGRELVLSKGSLTETLESLFGSNLTVELCMDLREVKCDALLGDYLGVSAGTKALEREAYLCIEGRRVVYAKSIFALADGEPTELLEDILKSSEPLGRSLLENAVTCEKDKSEVALVESTEGAHYGLSGDKKGPLALRRYRLFTGKDSKVSINAVLIEVFARELVEVK